MARIIACALAGHLPWLTLSKIVREARCGVLVVSTHKGCEGSHASHLLATL